MTMSEKEQMQILSVLHQMEAELGAMEGVQKEKIQEIRTRIRQMESMLEIDRELATRTRMNGEG